MLRISEARYAAGRAAQQDIFKAQTQFAIFETQMLRYRQERASKQIEIDALLNRPTAAASKCQSRCSPAKCRLRSKRCWRMRASTRRN